MLKSFRILLAGALLAPVSAIAVPITVDFSVRAHSFTQGGSSYAGYPLGTLGLGSFTFDAATSASASDLSFEWLGMSFDETTAQIWHLDFLGDALVSWGIGALPCTLSCITSPGPNDFFAGAFGGFGYAAAHVEGAPGFTFGSLQWSATSVPEPATLGLLGLGLLGAAAGRRKRAA